MDRQAEELDGGASRRRRGPREPRAHHGDDLRELADPEQAARHDIGHSANRCGQQSLNKEHGLRWVDHKIEG